MTPVEDTHRALRQITDDRVGGLAGHWAEVAVGKDEKARLRHIQGVTGAGAMVGSVSIGTVPEAFVSLIGSPYTWPIRMWRVRTMTKARIGTAITRPISPKSLPISSTPAMVITGGRFTCRSIT